MSHGMYLGATIIALSKAAILITLAKSKWGLSSIGACLGVLIRRIIVYWGLFWGTQLLETPKPKKPGSHRPLLDLRLDATLHGGFDLRLKPKGDIDKGIGVDNNTDVDIDMAVSMLWGGSFKRGLGLLHRGSRMI